MLHSHSLVITVTFISVICVVLIHYESLRLLTNALRKIPLNLRPRILLLIFGLVLAHLVEVWLFAFGYFYVDTMISPNSLQGMTTKGILDYVYFSAITYTTVGYGDIIPVGPIRFLNAMEALTGLLLIAWSSSFTFLEMRVYWRDS